MRNASSRFLAGIMFSLLASAVMADSPETPPAPSGSNASDPASVKPDDSKIIVCHQEPPPTGSHLGGGRVCKTKAEWDQETNDAHDYLKRAGQAQMNGGTGGH